MDSSAHTHCRSLRNRTAGFSYDELHDHWQCPEGQHLWPHEFDHERRLLRYRAKAHICNGCPRKADCTDSNQGREIIRPLDAWPHSEAGRFHRGLSLLLVALAHLVLVVGVVRNHAPSEAVALAALLVAAVNVGRWLLRDCRGPSGQLPDSVGIARPAHDDDRRRRRSVAQPLPVRGPGLVALIPLLDRMVRVDLRTFTLTIPPQEVITRDNVPLASRRSATSAS